MRRKVGSVGMIGPTLLGVGLVMLLLGFFGGAMGIPGLLMLGVGQDNPRIEIGVLTYIQPSSVQKVTATFHWIELLPEQHSADHRIAGVPLECFFQNESKGIRYTNSMGYAEWTFTAPSVPGYYEVTVAFHGNDQFPACSDSLGFVVKDPTQTQPSQPEPEPQQIKNEGEGAPRAASILKVAGIATVLLGLGVVLFRRP